MNTRRAVEEIALSLTQRATHRTYRLACVLYDHHGVFSWGWAHPFTHAEIHALTRANPRRLVGAHAVVAGVHRTGRWVLARPCNACYQRLLNTRVASVAYTLRGGGWGKEFLRT